MRAGIVELARLCKKVQRTLFITVNNKVEGSSPLTIRALMERMVADDARQAIRAGHIAVFPETTRSVSASPSGGMASAKMLVHAPALQRHATNNE